MARRACSVSMYPFQFGSHETALAPTYTCESLRVIVQANRQSTAVYTAALRNEAARRQRWFGLSVRSLVCLHGGGCEEDDQKHEVAVHAAVLVCTRPLSQRGAALCCAPAEWKQKRATAARQCVPLSSSKPGVLNRSAESLAPVSVESLPCANAASIPTDSGSSSGIDKSFFDFGESPGRGAPCALLGLVGLRCAVSVRACRREGGRVARTCPLLCRAVRRGRTRGFGSARARRHRPTVS
jgi:hypothetical protein